MRKPYNFFLFIPSRIFLNKSWRLGWTHFNLFNKRSNFLLFLHLQPLTFSDGHHSQTFCSKRLFFLFGHFSDFCKRIFFVMCFSEAAIWISVCVADITTVPKTNYQIRQLYRFPRKTRQLYNCILTHTALLH